MTGDGTWLAPPPGAVRGNPTGAGDAVVAGLRPGLARGRDWPDRLRQAVALGAATVAAPGGGRVRPTRYATEPPARPSGGPGSRPDGHRQMTAGPMAEIVGASAAASARST